MNTNETQHIETPTQLEGGTYEVLKSRLNKHGDELRQRLNELNTSRKEVFGSIESQLLGTDRVTTENNCVPWDMVPVGGHFIFGYNVQIGLRNEIRLADVFSVFEYREQSFHPLDLSVLEDETFLDDFKNLYRYYKEARFVKFAVRGAHLYMVFQVGKSVSDLKVFKWLMTEGGLSYIDGRSEHEYDFPRQHEFEWKRTSRDMHREGAHPHISIADRIFVETIGGDLTIKVEDNTKTGKGIFSEPVANKDQTLDDAEIHFAIVGNLILLKVKPYQENEFRYIVYNEKLQEAQRIDAIADSCVLLPQDHGLIFPNGYYLQTGEYKLFDIQLKDMLFEQRISSPNGEDYAYVFYNREQGLYLMLSYNLINQSVENPLTCHGFSIFGNGEMCYFKADQEPKKTHAIQIWQTPFVDADYDFGTEDDSLLYKIGNRDIVKAMAECHEILGLLGKDDGYQGLYLDLMKKSTDILDAYYWINEPDAYQLSEPLGEIKQSASSAIDEFEKVVRLRRSTAEAVANVTADADALMAEISRQVPKHIDEFVGYLSRLRGLRGEVISLKELRYVDTELVESYEEKLEGLGNELSEGCVKFLTKDEALAPYRTKVGEIDGSIEGLTKVVDANKVEENINQTAKELEMLIEIVGNLKIEDATKTTQIIDSISEIYSSFNQIRARLKNKRKELAGVEGKAEFNAQLKLIGQSVVNFLDLCDKPEKCEEYLTKLMVQLEELEGKFAEFDDFLDKIATQREEIYSAFESKKVQLAEARSKRTNVLQQSAIRILKSAKSKAESLKSVSEINGYFASDLMIDKVRGIIKELVALEDSVKADDLQSRLKTIKEDALRQLKDKQELFLDGDNIISFGNFKFLVNTQTPALSMVNRDGGLFYHLAGTNFFEQVTEEALVSDKALWEQSLVSENDQVYRAEYLAYQVLEHAGEGEVPNLEQLHNLTQKELVAVVQKFMAVRYNEGYVKGVHDHDTAIILGALVEITIEAKLLKYSPAIRSLAKAFWLYGEDERKAELEKQVQGAGLVLQAFPNSKEFEGLKAELAEAINDFANASSLFDTSNVQDSSAYLFEELTQGATEFVTMGKAGLFHDDFLSFLQDQHVKPAFEESLNRLEGNFEGQFGLLRQWLRAFDSSRDHESAEAYIDETALLLLETGQPKELHHLETTRVLDGLQGSHKLLDSQQYALDFYAFPEKLSQYALNHVPRYEAFLEAKKTCIKEFEDNMKLNEFKPRVMSSFVRNKLIDKLYLPLIGANLAKQMGTAGENKRTDQMGLLLLISPPGYGKTTLMEYVANRLGIVFMKINGPALGHEVTSVDPSSANNAGAKEELKKLNLAFEMGDNVMIYLDDIQHCHPEFLQKFISLCDGQRKIEGVYKGRPKTYDFRGRKVAVVMAGNPYTESGDKFQIPDMLANRADIYNLGDIIGDSADVFKLSYLENSLTSNPVLNKLSGKSKSDLYGLIKIAETGSQDGIEFEANHSVEEINEYVNVLKKMLTVRDVILRVNLEYIKSASQNDAYRTEPPFKLQGSYRNMNKIVEKVLPVMNDKELDELIMSHYEGESQTLTTGAEANLLKFKEMVGWITDEEKQRWADIKDTFVRNNKLNSLGAGNEMGQVLIQLEELSQGLGAIAKNLADKPKQLPEVVKKEEPKPLPVEVKVEQAPSAPAPELLEVLKRLGDNQERITSEIIRQKELQDKRINHEQEVQEKRLKEAEERKFLVQKALQEEETKLEALRTQIAVTVTEKGFSEENNMGFITYEFAFENKTDKALQGFSGTVEFCDEFGENIHQLDLSFDEGLEPNSACTWSAQMAYNKFLDRDILLKSKALEELEVVWKPKKVVYGQEVD